MHREMRESRHWRNVWRFRQWILNAWSHLQKKNQIDLCIVGMDDPLVGGLVDEMEAAGIRTFGPRKNAAILEGSKAFSKDLMKKYHIPTAAYENFDRSEESNRSIWRLAKFPIVLKADGLALGKGVLICQNLEEAKAGVRTIMEDKKFGTAGNTDGHRRIYDRPGGFCSVFRRWKDHQDYDFRTGPQTCRRRGYRAEYRWNGNFFTQSVLYKRSG